MASFRAPARCGRTERVAARMHRSRQQAAKVGPFVAVTADHRIGDAGGHRRGRLVHDAAGIVGTGIEGLPRPFRGRCPGMIPIRGTRLRLFGSHPFDRPQIRPRLRGSTRLRADGLGVLQRRGAGRRCGHRNFGRSRRRRIPPAQSRRLAPQALHLPAGPAGGSEPVRRWGHAGHGGTERPRLARWKNVHADFR